MARYKFGGYEAELSYLSITANFGCMFLTKLIPHIIYVLCLYAYYFNFCEVEG